MEQTPIAKAITELRNISSTRGNDALYDNGIEDAITVLENLLPAEREMAKEFHQLGTMFPYGKKEWGSQDRIDDFNEKFDTNFKQK
jgi:hypothetical protein